MDYQAKLNEEMAQRNQKRQNEYFGMTAEYNSAKSQKQRLEEAGLNPALMYGSAGSGGAGTGRLASGVGSFVYGMFGGGGINYHDQTKLMEKQPRYELKNMDYQAKLNEEMAQRNQERQNEYFGMTAEYNSAKNQKLG